MKRPPFFSIITVTLNPNDLLRETMASIAQQDFDDFEWIVKDAGSSDNSLSVLSNFKRSAMLIVTQPDTGIYDGMNQALTHASGTYVHFLNAGDLYASRTVLSQLSAALPRTSKESPALLYTYYQDLNTESVVTYPANIGKFFLYRSTICHQAQFLLRSVLGQVGNYDTSYPICADREMLLRLLMKSGREAFRVPFPAVIYHGRGMSAQIENLSQRDAQHRRLDLAYFSSFQRFLFETIKLLTFARLRAQLIDQDEHSALRRGYSRFRNIVRRWI